MEINEFKERILRVSKQILHCKQKQMGMFLQKPMAGPYRARPTLSASTFAT